MRVLLTFAGGHDPYNPEVVEGQHTDGPVLRLLSEEHFNRIYIFSHATYLARAHELSRLIAKRHAKSRTRIIQMDLPDPTDYEGNERPEKAMGARR